MQHAARLLVCWLLLLPVMGVVRWLSPHVAPPGTTLADALGEPFSPPEPGILGAATALGFLLLGAWLSGRIFQVLHLPRVSGYLLFGVLAGPHLLPALPFENPLPPLVTQAQLDHLKLVNALAISFIALTAGGEIRVEFLRRGLRRIAVMTGFEMISVFLGISAMVYFARRFIEFMPPDGSPAPLMIALVIATFAIASSPAIVIAVLSETRARGVMAQSSLTLVILKDLVLIIVFTVVVSIAARVLAASNTGAGIPGENSTGVIASLAWPLLGSIAVGAIVGALMSVVVRRIGDHVPLFVIGCALGIALMCNSIGLETLLVSLTAGFTMVNLWPYHAAPFFDAMARLALPVYCVFFAAAGAKIDIEALRRFWPLAIFIVAARVITIYFSIRLAARVVRLEAPARNWLWTALIPQAGVAVALIVSIEATFQSYEWAASLASLLLAVIAIHELIGPLLFRIGLARCGEIDGGPDVPDRRDPGAERESRWARTP